MLSSLDTVLGLGDDTLLWPGEVPLPLLAPHTPRVPADSAPGPEGTQLHLWWLLGANSSSGGRAPFCLQNWLCKASASLATSPQSLGSPVGPRASLGDG